MSFKVGITAPKAGSVVAKGAHSLVYKGKITHPDSGDSINVALKEYSVPAQTDADGQQAQQGAIVRLQEVAETLRGLAPHPNLLRCYGVEFIKGIAHRELDRVLVTQDFVETQQPKGIRGPLPEDELKHVARGLVAAIAHLHAAGLTHDDLRPCNVFRSLTSGSNGATVDGAQPAVLVTDHALFKPIAMLLDPSVGQVTTQRKPSYVAPEVLTEGTEYDPFKVDVWGVGCVVLELHTGKPPYTELDPKGTGAIMFKIVNGRKPPSYGENVSAGLKSFLDAAFTWSPDERPSIETLMEHPWLV